MKYCRLWQRFVLAWAILKVNLQASLFPARAFPTNRDKLFDVMVILKGKKGNLWDFIYIFAIKTDLMHLWTNKLKLILTQWPMTRKIAWNNRLTLCSIFHAISFMWTFEEQWQITINSTKSLLCWHQLKNITLYFHVFAL